MSIKGWVDEVNTQVGRYGMRKGLKNGGYELYVGLLRRLNSFIDYGTNIYDREWDCLILLDSCRVDALKEVADEYSFLDTPGIHYSPGSASYEWMEKTFSAEYQDEIARTAHITGNHFSRKCLSSGQFALLDEVWEGMWDDRYRTVLARPITDRAIQVSRESQNRFDRLIIHYMQPHFPSIPSPIISDNEVSESSPAQWLLWEQTRLGLIDMDDIWQAYIDNLRYVLDDVEVLLENLDAERVVISADHGNAFGEWGVYGHPNVPLKCLRKVPWYTTKATDEQTYDPGEVEVDTEVDDETVNERLESLGYVM